MMEEDFKQLLKAYRKSGKRLNTWARIIEAGRLNRGIRLSGDETHKLLNDDAIWRAAFSGAANDLGDEGWNDY